MRAHSQIRKAVCSRFWTSGVFAPTRRAKLLLQVQWVHSDIPPERRYNGLIDCIRRVYKEQVMAIVTRDGGASHEMVVHLSP